MKAARFLTHLSTELSLGRLPSISELSFLGRDARLSRWSDDITWLQNRSAMQIHRATLMATPLLDVQRVFFCLAAASDHRNAQTVAAVGTGACSTSPFPGLSIWQRADSDGRF